MSRINFRNLLTVANSMYERTGLFVEKHPIPAITYALAGSSLAYSVGDIVYRGITNRMNPVNLTLDLLLYGVAGLLLARSYRMQKNENNLIGITKILIKEQGFTQDMMEKCRHWNIRRLTRIVARELNMLEEFERAYKYYTR